MQTVCDPLPSTPNADIIDVDVYQPEPKSEMDPESSLDREILLNPVGWLNDRVISAAQILLKNRSSITFGDDTLQTSKFILDIGIGLP